MKKITVVLAVMATPLVVKAQPINTPFVDMDIVKICIAIVSVGLAMLFVLEIIKRFFEYRLKHKALELGVSKELASSILPTKPKQDRTLSIKWFFILAGIGTGLTIINYTPPLGIHSLAIMAFSMAAGFLGYFYFIKQSEK